MGAERFFNIKCRVSGLVPDAAVIVTTVRALKAHSGRHRIIAGRPLPAALLEENPEEVRVGGSNLRKQIQNVLIHGVTPVVAINAFPGDFDSEYAVIRDLADSMGVRSAVTSNFRDGGSGATDLAEAVVAAAEDPGDFEFLYPDQATLRTKIETIATRLYGAEGVDFLPAAAAGLDLFEANGLGSLPICIAKTHLSLSSDPKLKGAPTGWRLPVREVRASAGAGFIYAVCGDMRTMPGLSSHPAAERIDIDENGDVVGLS
jgi:formate--tetrahydrofolate ligase